MQYEIFNLFNLKVLAGIVVKSIFTTKLKNAKNSLQI